MQYPPITADKKAEWIKWLQSQQTVLHNKPNDQGQNNIFETGDGDVQIGKDLVGNLLAILTNQPVTID